MTTETGFIKGVDFVYIFTRDVGEAADFYGGTLELPELKRYGQMPAFDCLHQGKSPRWSESRVSVDIHPGSP